MLSNKIGLLIAGSLAVFDAFNMGILKKISAGLFNKWWLVLIVLLYALQPIIFLFGLKHINMTMLNLSWDLMSDILVTMVGLLYFKEYISNTKMIGVLLAIISIMIFSVDEVTF